MKKIWNIFIKFLTKKCLIKISISFTLGVTFIIIGLNVDMKYDTLFTVLTIISFSYIILLTAVGMIHGWIINMIKDNGKLFKTIKIKKGNHYPNIFSRIRLPIFYLNDTYKIERRYKFNEDSFFIFKWDDRLDWSKLFGLSFGHHQKNESYRFGIRFKSKNAESFNVVKYFYQEGKRIKETFNNENTINLYYNTEYIFTLTYHKKLQTIRFEIKMDGIKTPIYSNNLLVLNPKLWGYKLGTYIGGNNPAPNNIEFKRRYTK